MVPTLEVPVTVPPTPDSEVVNVATVPQLSPFRYPGGKTWLVPTVRKWLAAQPVKPRRLVEPFAGGAIVGLTAVFEDLVDEAVLVELDDDVAAVWETILSDDGPELARRIGDFEITHDNVDRVLAAEPASRTDQAFQTLLKNRVHYGGIIAPGASKVKNGENGRGLRSRWYPDTLRNRILAIHGRRNRISFIQGDGIEWSRRYGQSARHVLFVDPPYTVAGGRLYMHSEVAHETLFHVLSNVAADFLLTYDEAEGIRVLATKFRFQIDKVLMKTTKHAKMYELMIARDLRWLQ